MGGNSRPRRVGSSDGFDLISTSASVPLPASLSDLRYAGVDAKIWRHASDGKTVPDTEDLDPTAFRALVAMVWHAYDGISGDEVRHRMSAAVLKAYAVVGNGHTSYDGLRKALRILASSRFGVGGKTPERLVDVHLPPGFLLNSGMVEYGFTARGRKLFGLKEAGGRFVRAELAVLRGLKSVHSMRLYLLLARYPERREPVLNVPPSELCDLLGLPEGSVYRRQGDTPSLSYLNLLESKVFILRSAEKGHYVVFRVDLAPEFASDDLPTVDLPAFTQAMPAMRSLGIVPVATAVYSRLARYDAPVEACEINDLFAAVEAAGQPSWDDVAKELARLGREGATPASVMDHLRAYWRG
jgi:hypothetical protein